jgi:hypothetical protein
VGQPQLARAAVHQPHEGAVGAADPLRQRGRRVVGAREQQAAQEVGHRHALAAAQADDRLDRERVVGHRGEDLGELLVLEGDQRGHELGRRGDGPLAAGLALEDDVAGGRLDQDGGGSADRRRRGRGDGGARERESDEQDQRGRQRDRRARRHRDSRTRWPAWSVSAWSLGFSRWMVVIETPVLIEIADRVSPDFTM